MRQPGAILLLSCYELGHQPLNLASPLAFLAHAGYAPAAIDTAVQPLPDEAIAAARLVAISVPMHTALRLGVAVAERVRAVNRSAHLCFYGMYATLNAGYLLDGPADSVIGGEYEAPLLALAQALESGAPLSVEGVGTRHRSAAAVRARTPFRVPDRRTLPPLAAYAGLEHDGALTLGGYAEATHGCLHTCLHCPLTPVYGGRLFVVPANVVLADIRAQAAMGAGHITFGDPDFLNGPGHALKILRAMHDEFPHLTFDATIKVEHILERRALFPGLRALGCQFVLSAVESVSDVVLRRLDKGHTRRDVVEAIAITRATDITLRPSLLPFTPWETLEGYVELLDFFEEQRLLDQVDPVQYAIRLLVPPGSALAADLAEDGLLGPLDAAAYTYAWQHPDQRMDRLQREVAALVEAGERSGEHPVDTYYRIKVRSGGLLGRAATSRSYVVGAAPPRLTESWFC
ncbi:MAG: CUAEP/CCAEP-tail radical SAM protein [Chloroflexota bacterium]|nr:CUAEP/CCAEP-tail radical SAM protein [Chloroflexota bacterium]